MSVTLRSRERVVGRFVVHDISLDSTGPLAPAAAANAFASLKISGSPAVALVRKGVDQISSDTAFVLGSRLGAAGFSLIAFDEDTFSDDSTFVVVHVAPDIARQRGLTIGSRIDDELRNV